MGLLEIEHLTVDFATGGQRLRAVDDVSLSIAEGETLCLVGESGCGKSVTALSIARLLPSPPAELVSGRILVRGLDVLRLSRSELRRIRGGVVSYVFQEPAASLNPVMRIGDQILEALRLHRPGEAGEAEVVRLLKQVRIPEAGSRARAYPFQLSGGMQQRVMLAMALASQPKLLVADEPTTALDATIQAQMIELLRELKAELGMSLLLITHNLGIVGEMGGKLSVMYAGQIVEQGPSSEVLRAPLHPYTRALIDSVPKLGTRAARLTGIPGNVPRRDHSFRGCLFFTRCGIAGPQCAENSPMLLECSPGRFVRCPYATEPASASCAPGVRAEGSRS